MPRNAAPKKKSTRVPLIPERRVLRPKLRLTRQRILAEADNAYDELPAQRILFAKTAKAFFNRHGIPSCTERSVQVMDAELQRMLRHVTEVAFHAARASGRTRLTEKDFAFGFRQLKNSAYIR